MNTQQRLGGKELLAHNKAYKVTLEHCNETCDDIDKLFNDTLSELAFYNELTPQQERYIEKLFNHLNNEVKEQGTRKLRQAFVDYVLTGCSKLEQQIKD